MIVSTDPPCRFLIKASNSCRFSCSRVFLSLPPYDNALLLAYISRCLSTSHSPFWQFLSAKCFLLAFQPKKGDFAWGRICHLFPRDKKMKRGFSTLYLSPRFVFILYTSLLSAPLSSLFIQLGPPCFQSVLGGERTGRSRLAKCTGDSVIGTAGWRMTSLDAHLNPLFIWIEDTHTYTQRSWTKMHTYAITPLYAHHYGKSSCCMHTCSNIVMYYCTLICTHTHIHKQALCFIS